MNVYSKKLVKIFSFQLAFIITFFLGIFWNNTRIHSFNDREWFYINRGLPISWSGVGKPGYKTQSSIIQAPFLEYELYGTRYVKVIDLSIFFPEFAFMYMISYPCMIILVRFYAKTYIYSILTFITFGIFAIGMLFFYFQWFPRN